MNSENFIKSFQEEVSNNPTVMINNFDQFMALYDLVIPDDIQFTVHTKQEYPTVFELHTDSNENALKLKNRLDSHIQVIKYTRRFQIITSTYNNIVILTLNEITL